MKAPSANGNLALTLLIAAVVSLATVLWVQGDESDRATVAAAALTNEQERARQIRDIALTSFEAGYLSRQLGLEREKALAAQREIYDSYVRNVDADARRAKP